MTVNSLRSALEVIRQIGRPDFGLLIDTMHLIRSGSSPRELATVDPDLIAYVQLSDAPRISQFSGYQKEPMPGFSRFNPYQQEAMTERQIPGQGELPLLEILQWVPRDRVVSLELPLLSQAKAGIGPHERLRPAVNIAKSWLAQLN